MDPTCLQHRLTEAERQTFNDTGLLMIENALSPEQVATLTHATDAIYASGIAAGQDPRKSFSIPTSSPSRQRLRIWSIIQKSCQKCGASWAGTSICITRT